MCVLFQSVSCGKEHDLRLLVREDRRDRVDRRCQLRGVLLRVLTLMLSSPPGAVCDELEAEVVARGLQLVPARRPAVPCCCPE